MVGNESPSESSTIIYHKRTWETRVNFKKMEKLCKAKQVISTKGVKIRGKKREKRGITEHYLAKLDAKKFVE